VAGEVGPGALDPRLRVDQPLHAADHDGEDAGDQAGGEDAARPGCSIDEAWIEIAGEGLRRAGALRQAEPQVPGYDRHSQVGLVRFLYRAEGALDLAFGTRRQSLPAGKWVITSTPSWSMTSGRAGFCRSVGAGQAVHRGHGLQGDLVSTPSPPRLEHRPSG
jgi:hypothetical protein